MTIKHDSLKRTSFLLCLCSNLAVVLTVLLLDLRILVVVKMFHFRRSGIFLFCLAARQCRHQVLVVRLTVVIGRHLIAWSLKTWCLCSSNDESLEAGSAFCYGARCITVINKRRPIPGYSCTAFKMHLLFSVDRGGAATPSEARGESIRFLFMSAHRDSAVAESSSTHYNLRKHVQIDRTRDGVFINLQHVLCKCNKMYKNALNGRKIWVKHTLKSVFKEDTERGTCCCCSVWPIK